MASPQVPIGSGFGRDTTPADVLGDTDLGGTYAVVTGGYSGLGLETTRALAGAGADVVVPARRPDHATAVLGEPHGVRAFSVHPGGIMTELFKSPEQGAATSVWAATSPQLDGMGGVYCEDCDVAAPTDPASPFARFIGVDEHATDPEAAARLWALSVDLTGADAPFER